MSVAPRFLAVALALGALYAQPGRAQDRARTGQE